MFVNCKFFKLGQCEKHEMGGHPTAKHCAQVCEKRKAKYGLGEGVSRIAKLAGLIECGGCEKRRELLNRISI